MPNGDKLPFVRLFYGSPSTFLWEDEMGTVNFVPQGEGGEQGDPLMPLLFCLGQHRGLCAVAEKLGPREHLVAFLDDVYVATNSPATTVDAHNILGEEMWRHAKITLHFGKTVIWNKSGRAPEGVEVLEEAARRVDPVLWCGGATQNSPMTVRELLSWALPLATQSLCLVSSRRRHKNTASFWRGFLLCRTSSLHGPSCCIAPQQGRISG